MAPRLTVRVRGSQFVATILLPWHTGVFATGHASFFFGPHVCWGAPGWLPSLAPGTGRHVVPGRGGQVPFAGPHFSPLTCSNFGTTPRVDPSHLSHPGAQPLLNQKHCRSMHILRVSGLLCGCGSCPVMSGGHARNAKLDVRTYRLPVSCTEVPLAVRPRRLGDRRIRAEVLERNALRHSLGPGRQVAVDGVARGSGNSDRTMGIHGSQERGKRRHEAPQPAQHRRRPSRPAAARRRRHEHSTTY